MPEETPNKMTAAGRYETMKTERDPFLHLARRASELTIPGLIPPEGSDGTDVQTPYSGVGARGVNNLAAKLLLALFPPQGAFFRLTVDEFLVDELEEAAPQDMDVRAEMETTLSAMERAIQARIENTNARSVLSNAFKHLLVGGNYLLQDLGKDGLKGHPLSDYVVKRDLEGTPIEIVVLEELAPLSAPPEVLEIIRSKADDTPRQDDNAEDVIEVYTRVTREEKKWKVAQYVEDTLVEGSEGTYPLDSPAYIPLRWNPVDKQSYGRGHTVEYLGDHESAESLSRSVVQFAAAAAKIIWIYRSGAVTNPRDLRDAESGDFVEGDANDVAALSLDKFPDFRVAKSEKADIEERLKEAYLLNSSIQRDAERVTAEEIRFMAGELEQAFGGTYASLSDELQRPLVNRWMKKMQKEGSLPKLPNDTVTPKIITGIDGLGRASDFQKLGVLIADLGATFGSESLAQHVDVGSYIRRRAAALGVDPDGLIRTKEEIEAAIERQRQAQLEAQAVGPSIQAGGRLAEKAADVESAQPTS